MVEETPAPGTSQSDSPEGAPSPAGTGTGIHIRDLFLRVGKALAVPIDQIEADEVLADPSVSIGGTVGGRFPEGGVRAELLHSPRGNAPTRISVPFQERNRFSAGVFLRNGMNYFNIRILKKEGEAVLEEKSFQLYYKSPFREWNETIFIAFFLALMIRSLVVQAFWIPTGSMENTLLGEKRDINNVLTRSGDRILVNRFAYVIDLSLDGKFPFLPRFWLNLPQRGDIVVFKYPSKDPKEPPRDFIKRVIGLPGDSIKVSDGTVHVNGTPLVEDYIKERPFQDYETVVPNDSLFVMGDNRNNSSDSRYWGPMPLKNLKGQAVFLYWPFGRIQSIRSHPHQNVNSAVGIPDTGARFPEEPSTPEAPGTP